jgi:hypothetical protein
MYKILASLELKVWSMLGRLIKKGEKDEKNINCRVIACRKW